MLWKMEDKSDELELHLVRDTEVLVPDVAGLRGTHPAGAAGSVLRGSVRPSV